MLVVQNRLVAPKEFAERVEHGFRNTSNMKELPGFVSFKLLKAEGEVEEGKLLFIAQTIWRDRASFEAWRSGDAFARAHSSPEGGSRSPLQSQVEIFEILVEN